jgi:hypothetical protein
MINPGISGENDTTTMLEVEEDSKKLPTESQNNILVTTFDDFFFNLEMEEIEENISQGDFDRLERNENALVKEINSLIQEFSLSVNLVRSFEDISNVVDQLKEQLEKQYYISPSLLENLSVLKGKTKKFVEDVEKLQKRNKNLKETQS